MRLWRSSGNSLLATAGRDLSTLAISTRHSVSSHELLFLYSCTCFSRFGLVYMDGTVLARSRCAHASYYKFSPGRHLDLQAGVNVRHRLAHRAHAQDSDLCLEMTMCPRRNLGSHSPAMARSRVAYFLLCLRSFRAGNLFSSLLQHSRNGAQRKLAHMPAILLSIMTSAPAAMASFASSSLRTSTSGRSEKPPTSRARAIAAVIDPARRQRKLRHEGGCGEI